MARPRLQAGRIWTAWTSVAALLGSVALAACFAPDYPAGIPCSEVHTCPPGQACNP